MLKLISLQVVFLGTVPTRRSGPGTSFLPAYFISGRTIIYFLSPFRENNNVIVFPISFHIFMPLANLWLIHLQGQFPILRTRSCPDLYPLIHPPKRPLTLGRERILIPGFIRSPPTLAVYDVARSLPRGGVGRGFPFTEDEAGRHFSYLSGTFRESHNIDFHLLTCTCKM
jgi:hypothetical protein